MTYAANSKHRDVVALLLSKAKELKNSTDRGVTLLHRYIINVEGLKNANKS
jgi:hypothetical protein